MSVIDESKIKYIVIHCSATEGGMDFSAEDINRWHKERGWDEIGYHFVIRRNGLIEVGRDLDERGAHVKGHNDDSLAVCIIGGPDAVSMEENDFTMFQWSSLSKLVDVLELIAPNATVLGHRDFPDVVKECPCFDVGEWLKQKRLLYV